MTDVVVGNGGGDDGDGDGGGGDGVGVSVAVFTDAAAVIIYLPRFDLPVYSRWLPVGYLSSCSHIFLRLFLPLQEDFEYYIARSFLTLNISENRHDWESLLLRRWYRTQLHSSVEKQLNSQVQSL